MQDRREIWWLVALEAAVAFSVPAWILTDSGWPGVSASPFALAVVAGATVAWLVCHMLPAWCGASLRGAGLMQVVARAWFWLGAAWGLGQMAVFGSWQVLGWVDFRGERPPWRWAAGVGVALLFGLAPFGLAWWERGRRVLIGVSVGLGAGLLAVSLAANAGGAGIRHVQMVSEAGIDRPMDVFRGMVLAAAPASVVALRLGGMGLGMGAVCRAGVWGMWLPLAASVALMNVSKMWGARLYWRPSLPIEFQDAFAWLFQGPGAPGLWIWPVLSVTTLAVGVVCAVWMEEMTPGWPRWWRVGVGLAGVGWVMQRVAAGWPVGEYERWGWAIVAGWVAVGLWRGWIRLRGRGAKSPRSVR